MQTATLFLSRPANNQDFRDVDVTSWPTGFEVLNLVHIGGTEERVLSPLRHNTHFKHIEHKIKTEKKKQNKTKKILLIVELISLSFGGRHAEEQGKDFLISTPLF